MADFSFPNQASFYRGKVRDVYGIGSGWLVMIASDRISAFDVLLLTVPLMVTFCALAANEKSPAIIKANKKR